VGKGQANVIVVENLALRVGSFALEDVSFTIPRGHYGVLMGKTGCGKTSILEAICGLKPVLSGQIRLLDRDVTWLRPSERNLGYVPQDRALFSTMSVRDHLAFALAIRHWDRNAIERRVHELAELLGLQRLLHRKPQGLSGGEAQRVALGRALSHHPPVLLLDEPLSALDDDTREEMYGLLESVQEHTGVTTLHITHSLKEAKRLADELFVFREGGVKPLALDRSPESGRESD
jgi:ABC-type sugar transport system ATPase subunit